MKNRFKKLCAIIFTLCLLLPGKVQASSEKEDGKVLDFGTSADFPPYEYYEGDEIVGIDPDILRAIGDYMGVEVRLHDMDFNNIIASIDSGKIDGGAAGFTVTEERKKSVNFTDSFTKTSQIIITRKDSDIKEVEDLNNGVKIGTQLGTIGDTIAKDDFGEENVNSFNKVPDAILSLQNKKIDAVILDKHSAENFVNANKDLTIIETPYLEEEYAIAISKDNPELLEDMNEAIAALKESGEIDKIMDKYQKSDDKQASKGIFGRFKSNIIDNGAYKYLLDGLKTTLIVTICALIISFALGLLIALVRAANIDQAYENNGFGSVLINILDKIFALFVSIIRGTPSTIQLLIMFNVILVNLDNLMLVAIISFALNSSAYMSELFRGGINSVAKGEKEAARSLGLSNFQTMKKVTMPQALKNSLPALGNEVITLFKETSIAGFIGLADLTRGASIVISQTFDAATAYFSAAIIYLVIVLIIEKIFKKIERVNLHA
ncbi:MAG: ABC transporter substrate-binding protein/permease [Anaerococcus sp.]|jgi:polar amino acid ABC transporter, inner membrane subunit|uniref:ABC transporter substrate-binding protein/permease n=1 Tax=Anaerococcus sp. TaxID=1872515 RepID=UPI00290A5229|nr:ABC transporter substrate-binding protein/permease [Anaerococcus sp.]MDU5228867.1 ABC transporter substrate-binding protein/permease [Anaerococcus sp.]MDU7412052.1 ABC transporter substrate-binding protein/permease [Anaerococcus sp.]